MKFSDEIVLFSEQKLILNKRLAKNSYPFNFLDY